MRRSAFEWIALVSMCLVGSMAIASCSDDDSDGGASPGPGFTFNATGTGRPADSSFVFTIDEVGLGPDGYVLLRNFSEVASSPEGLYLCQPPDCLALPDVEAGAGEAIVISASGETEQHDVLMTWDRLRLTPSDGELGIYASEDTSDPAQVRAYLQWGSDPHEGTAAAIEAGFWVSGYAPTSEDATRLFQNEDGLWLFE